MRPIFQLLDMIPDAMSAGEPSDTIPPPMGEDDAYSATTKVGAMPAELMAKLRAEGLLPSESEERRLPPRPKPSAEKPPTTLRAIEAAKAATSESSPPSLISKPPGKDDETLLRPGDAETPRPPRLPSLSDESPSDSNLSNATSVAVALDDLEESSPEVEVQPALSSLPPQLEASAATASAAPPSSVSPPSANESRSLPAPQSAALAEQPAKKGGHVFAVLAILALAAVAAFIAFGK